MQKQLPKCLDLKKKLLDGGQCLKKKAYLSELYTIEDGFGGLVVSMLASGTRVRGFKPGRSRWIFRASSLRMPSFGGGVKESVPCPSFCGM